MVEIVQKEYKETNKPGVPQWKAYEASQIEGTVSTAINLEKIS